MRDELDSVWSQRLEQMKHELDSAMESVLDDPLVQQLLAESCRQSGIIGRALNKASVGPRPAAT